MTTNLVDWNNKNLLSYNSRGQKSEIDLTGLMSGCLQGWVPFQRLYFSLSLPFTTSRGCPHTLAHDPFLHLQSQLQWLSPSQTPLFWPPILPLSYSLRILSLHWTHSINSTPSLHLKVLNLSILSIKSLLPHKVTDSHAMRIGIWTSLGIHYPV